MLNIYSRYIDEHYDDTGKLSGCQIHCPEDFNFAYDVVDTIAKHEPTRPAMIWCNPEGEEHIFTFEDMKYWSDKTANYLAGCGIGAGDSVMVILRRHYQFWFVATALAKLGAVMVPATFMLKEHDLSYRLNRANIKALICTNAGDIAAVADAVAPECPSLQVKILVHGAGGGCSQYDEHHQPISLDGLPVGSALSGKQHLCANPIQRDGWLDFNTGVKKASHRFVRRMTNPHEGMLLYFSSGTSGNPKMVLHNSAYALAHIITAKHWHNVMPDNGLHFTIADTGWGKAVWGKYYGQWLMEACVLTYDFDRFHADEILALIEKYRVTTLCCPPTMYRLMMQTDLSRYDLSSLTYSTTAGEALNPDLFEFWKKHTGLTIFEGFGQTETPLTVANLTGSKPRPGSMGKPLPLYTVEIKREDGSRCNPGETGEICIKMQGSPFRDDSRYTDHPAGILMEYYRDPQKTADAIYDGWYHTGDTAWCDEDGFFWYVGRNDDVIKSSGYRIGPFEIESVLLEHEAVQECAVTGVPDELRGFAVKATIVLAPGHAGNDELTRELQAWVKQRTAPYKYPRIIAYVDELPKTVNGKIRRTVIREHDIHKDEDGLL